MESGRSLRMHNVPLSMRHPQRVDNMAARQVMLDKYVDSMGNLGSIGTPKSLLVRHHFPSVRLSFFWLVIPKFWWWNEHISAVKLDGWSPQAISVTIESGTLSILGGLSILGSQKVCFTMEIMIRVAKHWTAPSKPMRVTAIFRPRHLERYCAAAFLRCMAHPQQKTTPDQRVTRNADVLYVFFFF